MGNSDTSLKQTRLKLPASPEDIAALELGTIVYLDGIVYTAREGVYNKVLVQGADLPVDLANLSDTNFHCSPAAAPDPDGSYRIGGVTATASFRFSKWMPQWIERAGQS